jgi:2-aminoadipate transaminase
MKPFSKSAERMQPSAIRQMTKLAAVAGRDLITFAGGMPNPATFPLDRLAEYATDEIRKDHGKNLQYGMTAGPRTLLNWLSTYLEKKGIHASPDQIICTTGSQQAIDIITEVLIDPGDYIFVEKPTYIGALMVFRKSGATLVTVEQDQDGMILEDLRNKLAGAPAGSKKLIYIISNFQNPSGISLTEQRRKKLPSILEEQDAYLIEDDPYGEIYFGAENLPPAPVSASGSDRIFYLGTASKLVAPTFRTGWVTASEGLMKKIELAKESADLCGSLLDQKIVYRFCSSEEFQPHLEMLRGFYKTRYQAMLDALSREMPNGVSWTRPTGGFFIWVTLPNDLDAESFLEESILEAKVSYVIGSPFISDESAKNCLRLAFSVEDPDRIQEGITRLANVIRKRLGTADK